MMKGPGDDLTPTFIIEPIKSGVCDAVLAAEKGLVDQSDHMS